MTYIAHAADDAVVFQELLVLDVGKLRAAIGVQDDFAAILALPARHHYRLQHEETVLHRRHLPADNLARVQVEHRAQVQPAFAGAQAGDVHHPLVSGSLAVKSRAR